MRAIPQPGIIAYTYKGEGYVLVGNNVHPLTKITGKDLFSAKEITAPSRERGVRRENVKLGSIAHIADYDQDAIVLVVKADNGKSYNLKKVAKSEI